MVEHPQREDCYIARLLVRGVSPKDSRRYFLDVENVHGTDRYAVALTVKGERERKRFNNVKAGTLKKKRRLLGGFDGKKILHRLC